MFNDLDYDGNKVFVKVLYRSDNIKILGNKIRMKEIYPRVDIWLYLILERKINI